MGFVNYARMVVVVTGGMFALAQFIPAVFANEMNAAIVPETNEGEAHYVGAKNITLSYPAGSAVASELGSQQTWVTHTIRGDISSQNSSVISAITAFNRAMLDKGTPTKVTEVELTYTVVIRPGETNTLISYKIEAVSTIERFVLDSVDGGNSKIVDLEWRGIHVQEPIIIDMPGYGNMDINRPIGLMQAVYPETAEQIEASSAAEIFDEPILDFRTIDQKMDSWHFLFDPSGDLAEISAYSLGESSFPEGTFVAEEKEVNVTLAGTNVRINSQVPAPNAQLQIAGFSTLDVNQPDAEFAIVSRQVPEEEVQVTGNEPVSIATPTTTTITTEGTRTNSYVITVTSEPFEVSNVGTLTSSYLLTVDVSRPDSIGAGEDQSWQVNVRDEKLQLAIATAGTSYPVEVVAPLGEKVVVPIEQFVGLSIPGVGFQATAFATAAAPVLVSDEASTDFQSLQWSKTGSQSFTLRASDSASDIIVVNLPFSVILNMGLNVSVLGTNQELVNLPVSSLSATPIIEETVSVKQPFPTSELVVIIAGAGIESGVAAIVARTRKRVSKNS